MITADDIDIDYLRRYFAFHYHRYAISRGQLMPTFSLIRHYAKLTPIVLIIAIDISAAIHFLSCHCHY
jgi:hypothetical protein